MKLSYNQKRPTKRAPDKWDSAAFFDSFLASSFSCSQSESQPAHLRVTQTVGRLVQAKAVQRFEVKLQFENLVSDKTTT